MIIFLSVLNFFGVLAVTVLILHFLIPWLKVMRVLDVPNERSSHTRVTPRGGGLAPSAALVAGLSVAAIWSSQVWPLVFAIAAGGLSFLFFRDDQRSLGIWVRLGAQAVAVVVGLSVASTSWPPLFEGDVPVALLFPVLGIGWLWFVNLYNFMDGIDGISGVETASIGFGVAAVVAVSHDGTPSGLSLAVFAGGLMFAGAGVGFLTANWHPARVFLGDAGSVTLGFLGGGLLICLATAGQPFAALILPAYYVVDATMTLGRRQLRGEKIWQAHRQHAYQMAVCGGFSHSDVCWKLIGVNAALGLFAVISTWAPALAVIAAYVAAFGLYTFLLSKNTT